MMLDHGVVVGAVVGYSEGPSSVGAVVLAATVEQVGVEEESVSYTQR